MNKLISAFNTICPKKDIIIFNSFPDLSGNSLALYEYIISYHDDLKEKYQVVWMIGDMPVEEAKHILQLRTGLESHTVINKKSIKGIMMYFFSKYIVSTHGYFPTIQTSKSQTHINLWHGMPFKRIGRMLEECHENGKSDEADITIATSEVFQDIMSCSFGIDKEKVLVTGQTCNDFLISKTDFLIRFGIDKNKYNKVIIWMPTYRKSIVGDIRQDGEKDSFGVEYIIKHHFEDLVTCLDINNYLLIIKPHPMDVICSMKIPDNNRIKFFVNSNLSDKNIQLYELLSNCDVLLTDYSSVFIDFLVTGKPIAFICDDLKAYSDSRGFCFDNPREYMPGEFISDYDKFIDYLNNIDSLNSKWDKQYKKIQKKFNPFNDNLASERVCKAIW